MADNDFQIKISATGGDASAQQVKKVTDATKEATAAVEKHAAATKADTTATERRAQAEAELAAKWAKSPFNPANAPAAATPAGSTMGGGAADDGGGVSAGGIKRGAAAAAAVAQILNDIIISGAQAEEVNRKLNDQLTEQLQAWTNIAAQKGSVQQLDAAITSATKALADIQSNLNEAPTSQGWLDATKETLNKILLDQNKLETTDARQQRQGEERKDRIKQEIELLQREKEKAQELAEVEAYIADIHAKDRAAAMQAAQTQQRDFRLNRSPIDDPAGPAGNAARERDAEAIKQRDYDLRRSPINDPAGPAGNEDRARAQQKYFDEHGTPVGDRPEPRKPGDRFSAAPRENPRDGMAGLGSKESDSFAQLKEQQKKIADEQKAQLEAAKKQAEEAKKISEEMKKAAEKMGEVGPFVKDLVAKIDEVINSRSLG